MAAASRSVNGSPRCKAICATLKAAFNCRIKLLRHSSKSLWASAISRRWRAARCSSRVGCRSSGRARPKSALSRRTAPILSRPNKRPVKSIASPPTLQTQQRNRPSLNDIEACRSSWNGHRTQPRRSKVSPYWRAASCADTRRRTSPKRSVNARRPFNGAGGLDNLARPLPHRARKRLSFCFVSGKEVTFPAVAQN